MEQTPSPARCAATRPADLPASRRSADGTAGDSRTSRAGDALRATATLVEEQLRELRAALAHAEFDPSSVTAASSRADRRLRPADVEWWDAAASASASRRLKSYQSADVYVKKAARRVAAHRKWHAPDSSQAKAAREACTGALDDLRLASLVLQERHEEDAERIRRARGGTDVSRGGTDDAEHVELDAEFDAELDADARHDAAARLRAQIEPLIDAVDASARRLRRDAKAAAAEARRATRGDGESSVVADAPLSPLFSRHPSRQPDARLVEELRRASSANEKLRDELRRARADAAATRSSATRDATLAEAASAAAAAASAAADAEMVSLRKESARWRAMYDALREEAGRGVSASEADALRLAVKHAEDRHRRELTLLGTEHGNAHASLRRSLADAERRWADLAPRVDRAERRAEAALAALAEETARREAAEAESARLRGDATCAERAEAAAANDARAADARANDEVKRAERRYRDELKTRLELERRLERAEEEATRDWRVLAAEEVTRRAREDAAKERERADALQRELDETRREVIEGGIRRAGEAMAAAKRDDAGGGATTT